MLHLRFSQLKLRQDPTQQRTASDFSGEKIDITMDLVSDETDKAGQPGESNFLVPDISTRSSLDSMKKKLERIKHFRSTPGPRPSPTKGWDQTESAGHRHDRDISPLAFGRVPMCSPNYLGRKPPMSEELAKLCSDSPISPFKSDSDNSSCLFADDSFLSSADFADDVFDISSRDARFHNERTHWNRHDSEVSFDKYGRENESAVTKGAAIAGSPSKIRHKNSRAIRRIKSASSYRYCPFKSSPQKANTTYSGTRWYKAPTDTRLYEVRKRELKESNQAASNAITLPKRVLQFGDCDSQANQQDHFVEKAKTEIHVELATSRTETPESGYGSLNTTRQTPDLVLSETPVTRLPFPRTELVPSKNNSLYRIINTHAVPWLEKFDIISKLYGIASHVVEKIFSYLRPKDLVLFSSVSPRWRHICSSHPSTAKVRDHYLKAKENDFQLRKENIPSSSGLPNRGRVVTGPGTPLASVQTLGTPTSSSTPTMKMTRIDKFYELGKQLQHGEKLEKCKCGSPARIETRTRKASCSSMHCQFEFCIKCRMNYHGNSPCLSSTSARRARGPSVGSKKSKNNLRRHTRLSAND
nr:uncharacterized protein LOC129258782 [Lytechinus pictus]